MPDYQTTLFFDFTFKSNILTELKKNDIIPLCICLTEDIKDPIKKTTVLSTYFLSYPYSNASNGIVNSCIILLPDTANNRNFATSAIFNDAFAKQRRKYLIGEFEIIFLYFNKNGIWTTSSKEIAENEICKLIEEIKLYGFYKIFDEGGGILGEEPAHHYVLQNGFHSNKFIRAANIMRESFCIDFLAIFLLDFVKDDTEIIFIDTSGIISLPYAVTKLKNIFLPEFNISIVSFNSYTGPMPDPNLNNKKILISTSTSGGLSKILVNIGFKTEEINTLFYLSRNGATTPILCNLSEFQLFNEEKYSYFEIEPEARCPLCPNASYPIKIVGEQFLPEDLKVETIEFYLNHKPAWMDFFLKNYFTQHGIIQCFFKTRANEEAVDFFINFENILLIHETDKELREKLDQNLALLFKKGIDAIIFYNDTGSVYFKDLILKKADNGKLLVLKEEDLITLKDSLTDKNILIVTATFTTGRRLIDTSLKLREVSFRTVSYLIGISRTTDHQSFKNKKKYISYDNKGGPNTHPIVYVDQIFISDTSRISTFSDIAKSNWLLELELLEKLQSANNNEQITSRVNDLKNNRIGLVNNLFWSDSNNSSLKLRPNFAFFKGHETLDVNKTTQAEVFFLFNSILHELRIDPKNKQFQSAFHRHVISPNMFTCYNDGIIQASILRSANPIELNYSFQGSNTKIANEIIDVLAHFFDNFDNKIGEATLEFLISISTKRLQVNSRGLEKLIEKLISKVAISEVANKEVLLILCDFIKSNVYYGNK